MWMLYNLATKWHSRPSELVSIADKYQAYCFDQAVTFAGSYIQNKLDNVKLGKGKNAEKQRKIEQENLLNRLLYGKKSAQPQYADPAKMLGGGNA